jgi:RNA polymerase sporulation-specific sigma factor
MDEEQIIHDNMAMVVKIAKSFNPNDDSQLDDFVQLGRIGLMKAVRKYDASRGTKFTTYAWNRIKWEILGYINRNAKHTTHKLPFELELPYEGDPVWELLPSTLSPMEEKVVLLKSQGHTFKQIGKLLGNYTRGWANKLFRSAREKIIEANET